MPSATPSSPPISGDCAGFDVLSAQVSFYNVADPGNILESFTLDPDVNVTGISIAGGQLAGVDTNFFDYFVRPRSPSPAAARIRSACCCTAATWRS